MHAGCGHETELPPHFGFGRCESVRLDIDPAVKPDIVASLIDMGDIGPFDAAFCSHALEHLYPYEVSVALAELYRVLRPGGHAVLIVPDLEGVLPNEDVVYVCPSGPICGLDMYYGCAGAMRENPWMAHHSGFVADTLKRACDAAGFETTMMKIPPVHSLIAIAQRKHNALL